jgi:hypothetical protein
MVYGRLICHIMDTETDLFGDMQVELKLNRLEILACLSNSLG